MLYLKKENKKKLSSNDKKWEETMDASYSQSTNNIFISRSTN
jgi:hypothetical protein